MHINYGYCLACRVDDGEKALPVATNLPSRYLSHEHHGRAVSEIYLNLFLP